MRTILDTEDTWFLKSIECAGGVNIVLMAGRKRKVPEMVEIRGVSIGPAYPVERTSRRVGVTFGHAHAHQVIDESYTSRDEYECGDQGIVTELVRSRFLDYMHEHHALVSELAPGARHFRVWTEDAVIDVLTDEPPEVRDILAGEPPAG